MGFFTSTEIVKQASVEVDVDSLQPNCLKCKLYKTCISPKMPVSGEGKKKILIIGEAPGKKEDEYGIAMIGGPGEFLKEELKDLGISLNRDCWKINAVNCRPPETNTLIKDGSSRPPSHTEIKCCFPFVEKTIRELKPKVIILFGTIAITSIFGDDFSNRTMERWRNFTIPDEKYGCFIIPMYHPAFVIRNEKDKNLRELFFRDLKSLISCLNREYIPQENYEEKVTILRHYDRVISLLKRVIRKKPTIAFDYETSGLKPYREGHKISTIAFAVNENKAYAFPFNFNSFWTAAELKEIQRLWYKILADPEIKKICHNCFSGDTKYLTKNGIMSFKNTDGTIQEIWTSDGWKKAKISNFGKNATKTLTLVPYNRSRSSISHDVKVTGNHRWKVYRAYKEGSNRLTVWRELQNAVTDDLKEKDRIVAEHPVFKINKNSDAFRHGLIFADGSRTSRSKRRNEFVFQLRLCGWKEKYKELFQQYSYPSSCNGDPMIWCYESKTDLKKTPKNTNAQYIAEFIEGWQQFDGTDSTAGDSRVVTTFDKEAAYWLKQHASIGGWICSGFSRHKIKKGSLSKEGTKYWMIVLTRQLDISWTVKRIKQNKKIEDVFCATVIDGKDEFTLNHGIYTKNCKFEDAWSKVIIGTRIKNIYWDTMIAQKIIDNRGGAVGLKFQTFVRYGIRPYDKSINPYLKSKNGEFNTIEKAPLKELLIYNGLDCIYTYMLFKDQNPYILKRKGLLRAYNFFMRGIKTMSTIQLNGITVDTEFYKNAEAELSKKIDDRRLYLSEGREAKKFEEKFGRKINVNSNTDLGLLFFEVLGKKPVYTGKGNYKTDKSVLESLNLPFVDKLLEMKKYEKIKGTYLAQFAREVYLGIIHPFFDLHIPVSYRSSSSGPNFQNIPKRDAEAKRITRMGIIPYFDLLGEIDFSGAEVATSASYHRDKNFINYLIDPNSDMHADNAMDIWMLPSDWYHDNSYTKEQKKLVKMIRFYAKNNWTFAQFYGDWFGSCGKMLWENVVEAGLMLPNGISVRDHLENMGIFELGEVTLDGPTPGSFLEHCKKVEHKMWNERFPEYTQWKKDIVEFYQRHGFIETYFGFRFTGYMDWKQCCNYPIQGTSFHLLLFTLIQVDAFLRKNNLRTRIIGQIHDSMILDMPKDEVYFVLTNVKRIVSELKDRFKWMVVPMEIEIELSKPKLEGGCFAEMEEYTLPQIKEMYA